MEFKIYLYILLFYLIFCNNIIGIRSKSVRCLGYNGKKVSWWFLLSKQTSQGDASIVGGGYLYVDSSGIEADIDHNLKGSVKGGETKQEIKTIKQIVEQHTNKAYTDNKPVFDKCTTGEYKLIKDHKVNKGCNGELNKFFNAQTWYHDTVEQQDNVVSEAIRTEGRKESEGPLTGKQKDAKYKSEMEDLDTDKDGESYGVKKRKKVAKTLSKGPMKSKYEKIMKEDIFMPKPNSNRHAHSKFLVSVNVVSGEGYILDHSANIPTFSQKTEKDKLYKAFAKQILLKTTEKNKEEKKKQGSLGKFIKSHHFFCFNFEQVDFDKLMNVIKVIKPRFVMSNYIGKNYKETKDISLIENTYNVKKKLSDYVVNDKCSNYYNKLYKQAINKIPKADTRVTSDTLVNELLDKTSMDTLITKECLSKYTTQNGITVHGFNSRNKPTGWDDKLNKEVSSREDNYKLLAPHLTFNSYGLDPYTIVAKSLGGPFYVSTMAQAGRVEIPSIKTNEFSIYVLKSWKGDTKVEERVETKKTTTTSKTLKRPRAVEAPVSSNRHEKLLFAHEDNKHYKDIVMIGDVNRNVVQTLYAGLNILLNSKALAILLRSKVGSVTTYNMYDENPDGDSNIIKDKEYSFGNDGYRPGFIHSLIKQNEIVLNLKDDSSSDEDEAGSDGDKYVGKSSSSEEEKKPPKKVTRVTTVKTEPKPKKKAPLMKKTKEEDTTTIAVRKRPHSESTSSEEKKVKRTKR